MNLLNLSHPLTARQIEQIEALVGQPASAIIEARVQFDLEESFVAQVIRLLDDLNIAPERWQGEPWMLILPSLNYIAAILLAELHGRMGHFPAIVRLRPVPNALVTEYEVAEIVNLEQVRQAARARR
ncbi:MAG: hypothetical protein HPY64_08150 [Anaerolineae bacterium]|nr:hypothetical protein [Anaerolineae bacterium]